MIDIMKKAHAHKGTSVIEVFQNCPIFNDKVHDDYTNRATRDENSVRLEAGQPMIFGKDKDQGLIFEDYKLKKVKISEEFPEDKLVKHDPTNIGLVHLLSYLEFPDSPVPIGVIKADGTANSYDEDFHKQLKEQVSLKGKGTMKDLLHSGETWEVK